ncbi:MAG TPA: DUF2846 domain-containing protein [Pyrinomonadaceae bacterium]|nr:DUF2846 domain-containing protein [Pyrinomonadaceae bacterium]
MGLFLVCLALSFSSQTPQPEKATVYFYRIEEAPRMVRNKPKLRINGKTAATFPEQEFIGVRLNPGRYVFTLGQPQSATALVVEAGKTYFVQVSYTPGGHGFNGLLDQIFIREEPQATLHFEQIKRPLEDKNIKDRTLDVVKAKPASPNR